VVVLVGVEGPGGRKQPLDAIAAATTIGSHSIAR
jgi:hypothetical protein